MKKLSLFPLLALFALLFACAEGDPTLSNKPNDPGRGHLDGPDRIIDEGEVVPPEAEEEYETGLPDPDEIRINDTVRFQKLDGIGANSYAFPFVNDNGWNFDAVKDVFDELDLHYIRLASWFEFWEPEQGVYDRSGIIRAHDLGFAQYLASKDIKVELGVWNVADWMLSSTSPRRINPDRYPALGASIASYVNYMRENGVPMEITEVQNEPGIEARVIYNSPEDVRDAAKALIRALDEAGLEDVMIHGPNWHAPLAAGDRAAEIWLEDDELRERTIALSYHTWWVDTFERYDAIRQIAEKYGKPVWATEVGFCALPGGCNNGHYLLPDTYETAFDFAMSYYRAIAWSRAERLYHWTVLGHDPIVEPGTGRRYPTFYVLKHFANYISPGSRFVETASGDPEVLSLAFLHPNGDRTVILINHARSETKRVAITDVRGTGLETIEAMLTTPSGTRDLDALDAESIEIPARSVLSVRFE